MKFVVGSMCFRCCSVRFNKFQNKKVIVDNLLITYILGAPDIPKNFYEIHARAGRVIECRGCSETLRGLVIRVYHI